MYIERTLLEELKKTIKPNKVLILLGARRVGKTELLNHYLTTIPNKDYLLMNGEDQDTIDLLKEKRISHYQRLFTGIDLLVIDEAQNIPQIGQILKLIVDHIKGLKIIATGSSMFDVNNILGEPLVGRKNTLHLYPFAQTEYSAHEKTVETYNKLEERLIFGSYPELEHLDSWEDKEKYLKEMVSSFLLKDILAFDHIRNSKKIIDLLRLIAFQVGHEVSIQELGRQLGMSKNTVDKYLDLLSKVFIIYKIKGFSRNLRKEISKSDRWYFYDNGIRNAIIGNYNRIKSRTDVGDLWENYLASERVKYQSYKNMSVQNYFWRTYDRQEIDWIEDCNAELNAFEFKWNPNKTPKVPAAWKKTYPKAKFQIINNRNYLDWIT